MKTLVLGLGNPILSDDGVGIRVAKAIERQVNDPDVTVLEASLGGLNLLDLLVDYDRAIIIDAVQTEAGKAGEVYHLDTGVLDVTRHTTSSHGVNFGTALELGRKLGMPLPRRIDIFAVEAADVTTFSEECTADVEKAVPVCAGLVIQALTKEKSEIKKSQ